MSALRSARRQLTPLEPVMRRLESLEALDEPAKQIAKKVREQLPRGMLKDALSGTWLGHAVHPMLTDVVIGSFTSAALLDVTVGSEATRARQRLIGLGLLAYLPTSAAGVNDWADAEPVDDTVRRVGAVHAVSNGAAALLFATSWLARRRRGTDRGGTVFALTGLLVLAGGGYLGGHLSLSKGIGADQTVFDPGPTEWTPAADASLLPERRPVRAMVQDTPVLLVRENDQIFAIHDRCSHRGCSLSEGTLEGQQIVCGCHGSRFDLHSGALVNGPATAAQPVFQVRVEDNRVEVRRLVSA